MQYSQEANAVTPGKKNEDDDSLEMQIGVVV